ncbi:MAG: cupin domain-containing protein [Verrucomicrobia bacterium]|nr:cupin domain-containing protein [Verrucomicrobiota bacterium]
MNSERFNELAALNAVGALEGAEWQEWQTAAANADPAALAEAAGFNNVAALLAAANVMPYEPPPALKARILERVHAAGCGQKSSPFHFRLAGEGAWQQPLPDVRLKELFKHPGGGSAVLLVDMAPGARYPHHHHTGAEECYVLAGDFHVEGRVLHGGDFHHAEGGSDHGKSFTEGGCQLLVVVAAEDYR